MYMLEVLYVLIIFFVDACLVTAKLSSKSISNIFCLLDWLFFAISKCKGLHKFHFVLVRFQIVLIFLKQSEYFLVYPGYPEEEIFFLISSTWHTLQSVTNKSLNYFKCYLNEKKKKTVLRISNYHINFTRKKCLSFPKPPVQLPTTNVWKGLSLKRCECFSFVNFRNEDENSELLFNWAWTQFRDNIF